MWLLTSKVRRHDPQREAGAICHLSELLGVVLVASCLRRQRCPEEPLTQAVWLRAPSFWAPAIWHQAMQSRIQNTNSK